MKVDLKNFNLRDLNESFLSINEKKLYRFELGTASIGNEIKPLVEILIQRIIALDEKLFFFDIQYGNSVKGFYTRFFDYLFSITAFTDEVYVARRGEIINSIKSYYTEAGLWWSIFYSSEFNKNSETNDAFNKLIDDAETKLNEIKNDLESNSKLNQEKSKVISEETEKIIKTRESLTTELDEFKERYKDIFSTAEILKQEDIFRKEAKNNKQNAKNYLRAALISFSLLIVMLIRFITNLNYDLNALPSIQSYINACKDCSHTIMYFYFFKGSALKLILISIGIYLIKVLVSLQKTPLHNAANNLHKANSFAATLYLFDRLTNDSTKEKIMTTGAEAIFKHVNTGYYKNKESEEYVSIIDKLLNNISNSKIV